jgi:hypothetical protein
MAGELNGNQACYWEDTTARALSGDRAAFGLYVSDGTVYTSGADSSAQACYWENTTGPTVLSDAPIISIGRSVFVKDGDVYVAGFYSSGGRVAAYWKNGERVESLSGGSDAEGLSIFVD